MATQVSPVKIHSATMREAFEKVLPFVLAVRPSEDVLCRTLQVSWEMSEKQARAAALLLVTYAVPEDLGETPLGDLIALQMKNISGTWQYLARRNTRRNGWSFNLHEYQFRADLTFTFTRAVRSTSGYVSPSVPAGGTTRLGGRGTAHLAGFYIPIWKKNGTHRLLLLKEDGSVKTADIVVYPRLLEIDGVPYRWSSASIDDERAASTGRERGRVEWPMVH